MEATPPKAPLSLLSIMSKRGGEEVMGEPDPAEEAVTNDEAVPEPQALAASGVRSALSSGSDEQLAAALKRFIRVARMTEEE